MLRVCYLPFGLLLSGGGGPMVSRAQGWLVAHSTEVLAPSVVGALPPGVLVPPPASCPPFFLSPLPSLLLPPPWQAACNPNLFLTSPLQLSVSTSKLNITHGDESPLGSAWPGGGLVCGRRWVRPMPGLGRGSPP